MISVLQPKTLCVLNYRRRGQVRVFQRLRRRARSALSVLSGSKAQIVNSSGNELINSCLDKGKTIGDFHFKSGQVAPVHTQAAPAVGYVAKGDITFLLK